MPDTTPTPDNIIYLDLLGDGGLFPQPPRTNGGRNRGPGFAEHVKTRLSDRQAAAVERGQHPLSVALRSPLPLLDVGDAERPTCGTCLFRRHYNPGHARSYAKCLAYPQIRHMPAPGGGEHTWTDYPRVTNGEGTDIRSWWPACPDYQPKEPDSTRETRS